MKLCSLDSSFIIDLLNEVAANQHGAALNGVAGSAGGDLCLSPVTCSEVFDGSDDIEVVREDFRAVRW